MMERYRLDWVMRRVLMAWAFEIVVVGFDDSRMLLHSSVIEVSFRFHVVG